jgi:uncharacterized protein YutE (UPF0331/DUF86 family)
MTNKQIIKAHIESIYENLAMLDELKAMPIKQFISDTKTIKLCEHCLLLAIQGLLDICHYIIANNNLPRPKDNREAILILGMQKVIPTDFAEKIAPMANLRNLLIHEYLEINPGLIHKNIQEIEDFRTFSQHILRYIHK